MSQPYPRPSLAEAGLERHCERIYNTVRPHHSLAGRTPAEYLT